METFNFKSDSLNLGREAELKLSLAERKRLRNVKKGG